MKRTFLVLFLLTVGFGFASPTSPPKVALKPLIQVESPRVTAPDSVEVGDAVVLALSEIKEARVVWIADGVNFVVTDRHREIIDTDGDTIEFKSVPASSLIFKAEKPGVFTFTCLVIPHDIKQVIKQTRHVVAVKGKIPDEGGSDDGKKKDPEEDPKPNADVGAVVVIEQRSVLNEASRNIRMSETWRKMSQTKEIVQKASWYDVDNPEAADFVPAAKSVGLPAVLLFDKSGTFLKAYPLPKTEKALLELVQ